jgi:hypothetical protein
MSVSQRRSAILGGDRRPEQPFPTRCSFPQAPPRPDQPHPQSPASTRAAGRSPVVQGADSVPPDPTVAICVAGVDEADISAPGIPWTPSALIEAHDTRTAT